MHVPLTTSHGDVSAVGLSCRRVVVVVVAVVVALVGRRHFIFPAILPLPLSRLVATSDKLSLRR